MTRSQIATTNDAFDALINARYQDLRSAAPGSKWQRHCREKLAEARDARLAFERTQTPSIGLVRQVAS